jgi:tetratricopeptide (TPR) repeat protein
VDDLVQASSSKGLLDATAPAQKKFSQGILGLLVGHAQERWLPAGDTQDAKPLSAPQYMPLPPRLRLAIADYLSQTGDERAVPVYYALLREKEVTAKTLPIGQQDRVVGAVNHLATYFVNRGEVSKAIQLYADAERYSTSPYWKATIRLDAARLYRRVGDVSKAQQLYSEISQFESPWLSGVAAYDQARLLLRQQRFEAASDLLSKAVEEAKGDRIQMALIALLSNAEYQQGKLEAATKHAASALSLYEALGNPEDMQWQAGIARDIANTAAQFHQQPIICEPAGLSLAAGPTDAPAQVITGHLSVRTLGSPALVITSDNPHIRAAFLESGWPEDDNTHGEQIREVRIEIEPAAFLGKARTTLMVRTAQAPTYETRVPITINSP